MILMYQRQDHLMATGASSGEKARWPTVLCQIIERRLGESLALISSRRRVLDAVGAGTDLHYRVLAKWFPSILHRRYFRYAQLQGLDRPYFILSFDCDTPNDLDVAWDVHSRLLQLGITPAYAVPGQLLEAGEATFRRIAETGAEFINHGYTIHAYFDETRNRYASCYFYGELRRDEVRDDIMRGHDALLKVLGAPPMGFRAPHFGTFQKPDEVRFIHEICRGLGYQFTSSTGPIHGFRHGPLFDEYGLLEIPVTGSVDSPLVILDTWGCFEAPDRSRSPKDYFAHVERTALAFSKRPSLINYYGDPSHIFRHDIFFSAMAHLRDHAHPTSFRELTALAQARAHVA